MPEPLPRPHVVAHWYPTGPLPLIVRNDDGGHLTIRPNGISVSSTHVPGALYITARGPWIRKDGQESRVHRSITWWDRPGWPRDLTTEDLPEWLQPYLDEARKMLP